MPELASCPSPKQCQCFTTDEIRTLNPAFSFNPPRSAGRPLPLSWTRDVEAALNTLGALAPYGYRLGESIRNKPPEHPPRSGDPLLEIETELGRSNVVFWGTRFVLDDPIYVREDGTIVRPVKHVPLGHTTLERDVFAVVRPYFAHLDRVQLTIAPFLRSELRPGYERYWSLEFQPRKWARIRALGADASWKPNRKEIRTLGVVMRLESIKPDGPGLLALWAMEGTIGVLLSYLVAQKHPEWLLEEGLRLVELVGPPISERPTSLRFALDWEMNTILHHRIRHSEPARVSAQKPVAGRRPKSA